MQLGDRMSPAFNLMAKAVGVSTAELDKLMQQGKVLSADVLPKFGKNLREFAAVGLEKSLKSNVKAMHFMFNAFTEAAETFFASGQDGLTDLFNSIKYFVVENKGLWNALGAIFGGVAKVLASAIKAIGFATAQFSKILDPIVDVLGEFTALLLLPIAVKFVPALGAISTAFLTATGSATGFNAALLRIRATAVSLARMLAPLMALIGGVRIIQESIQAYGSAAANGSMTKGAPSSTKKDLFGIGGSSSQETPIQVNATLNVDGEVMGRSVARSNAMENRIDERIGYANS